MDSVKLKRFVELEKERRELKARLESIKPELEILESDLLDDFSRDGIKSINSNGLTTYIKRQLWAKAYALEENPKEKDYVKAVDALRNSGLDIYVQERFNVNSLSAYVREAVRNGEELPEALKKGIDVSEKFSLVTRKSSSS